MRTIAAYRTAALSLLFILLVAAQGAHASMPLKPLNGKSVTIQIGMKQHIYHFVTSKEPVNLEITGPVKLEIVTRLSLPGKLEGKSAYTILMAEKGVQLKAYKTTTAASDASFVDDPASVGKSRKCTLDVPEGDHVITFSLESDASDRCALRFVASGKKNLARALHGKSVRVEPLSYERAVTAVVSEKLISYYVATKDHPVQLRVIGPTDVVVDARLNFDNSMTGKQSYTLAILEASKTLLSAPLTSTKSVGAFYKEWKEVVPGKINRIRVNVPEGEHIYSFELRDAQAASVALKFSLPEKAISNTK